MTEKTVAICDKKMRTDKISAVESIKIDLSDKKILTARAEACVLSHEPLTEEFRLTIRTTFSIVLLGPDGTYERKEEIVENMRSVSQKGIDGYTKSSFYVNVGPCAFTQNGDVSVEETIYGIYIKPRSVDLLVPSDDLVCRQKTERIAFADLTVSDQNLTFSDEARLPIKTVLDCSANAFVTNVYPSGGAFRAEGEIVIRLVALTDNDQFLSQTFSHPFGIDVVAEIDEQTGFDTSCILLKCAVSPSDGDGRAFLTEIDLRLVTALTKESDVTVVTDCYSIKNEVSLEATTLSYDADFCSAAVSDKASAVLPTGGTVNEVYACFAPAVLRLQVSRAEAVTVEGAISATVLYADENLVPTAKTVEIPFSTLFNRDFPCAVLHPDLTVRSCSARLKTGSDIEVSVDYSVTLRGTDEKTLACLADATLGADKEPDDVAICLYPVREGEDLFAVAKALNVTEQTLLDQNPDLSLPLVGGEQILLYNGLSEE